MRLAEPSCTDNGRLFDLRPGEVRQGLGCEPGHPVRIRCFAAGCPLMGRGFDPNLSKFFVAVFDRSPRSRRSRLPGGVRWAQLSEGLTLMPDKRNTGTHELHETVRGGERVLIRRFRAEDKALYADFLRDVSADDLRLRFFARIAELSADEADRLAHLDDKREMAFVALDEDTGHMLGLVRLKGELDEKTAEFAILVRSRLKGHGLGWLLMRHVIDYAKEKDLRRVFGDVLAENATMLQMCAELGFYQMDMGSDLRRVVLDLESYRDQ